MRGVDPRDVVRLPAPKAEEWLARWMGSKVAGSARRYLARIDEKGPGELVFPRADLARDVADGDEAAAAAVALVASGEDRKLFDDRPLKRPTDLRAGWTLPAVGTRRFVIEDGRVPTEVTELAASTVPAQRMFLLDGDAAVPLLLSSRVFAVWARATTSRSTSWLPRFSISRTFETLPIPPCFELVVHGDGRPSLQLGRGMIELDRIAHELEEKLVPERRWRRFWRNDENGEMVEPSWREVDQILLEAIGLRPDVSDVEVLKQLLSQSN